MKSENNKYDFLKTLNDNVKYCVLREFEELDLIDDVNIDILVEDRTSLEHLEIPMGINVRYVGDDYYCKKWEEDILFRRQLINGIYVPCNIDYKYSLLYHCLLQDESINSKYNDVLRSFNLIGNEYKLLNELSRFMVSNMYEFVSPSDTDVYSNTEYIDYLTGRKIKIHSGLLNGKNYPFIDCVYEREYSFIKYGVSEVIDSEKRILSGIWSSHFPRVISYGTDGKFSKFEMTRIYGDQLYRLEKSDFINVNGDKIFNGLLDILIDLLDNNVIHRDLSRQNIIVDETTLNVGLVDFGWAEYITNIDNGLKPITLPKYRPKDGFSDPYAMGVIIDDVFGDRYKDKTDILKTIYHKDYKEPSKIKEIIRTLYIK